MKGFTNKQPKIVAACVGVLTRALRLVHYYIVTFGCVKTPVCVCYMWLN